MAVDLCKPAEELALKLRKAAQDKDRKEKRKADKLRKQQEKEEKQAKKQKKKEEQAAASVGTQVTDPAAPQESIDQRTTDEL